MLVLYTAQISIGFNIWSVIATCYLSFFCFSHHSFSLSLLVEIVDIGQRPSTHCGQGGWQNFLMFEDDNYCGELTVVILKSFVSEYPQWKQLALLHDLLIIYLSNEHLTMHVLEGRLSTLIHPNLVGVSYISSSFGDLDLC